MLQFANNLPITKTATPLTNKTPKQTETKQLLPKTLTAIKIEISTSKFSATKTFPQYKNKLNL